MALLDAITPHPEEENETERTALYSTLEIRCQVLCHCFFFFKLLQIFFTKILTYAAGAEDETLIIVC